VVGSWLTIRSADRCESARCKIAFIRGSGRLGQVLGSMETVHAVWEYHDGPRTGIANYLGQPYYFQCQWNSAEDDSARIYLLAAIDAETLALALEQWDIWREWELAFHSGHVSADSHPGRGGRDARYDELELVLQSRLNAFPPSRIHARASFHPVQGNWSFPVGVMRPFLVEWSDAA
jgi:hypothetical protein